MLGIGRATLPETATDIARHHAEFFFRQLGVGAQLLFHHVHALHASVHRVDVVLGVVGNHESARLHGARHHTRRFHFDPRHVRRLRKGSLGSRLVARFELERHVARHALVKLGCAWRNSGFHVDCDRQVCILDFDQVHRVLRSQRRVRHDDRNRFAYEAHPLVREHRPIRYAGLHAVLAGEIQHDEPAGVARTHRIFAGVDARDAASLARRRSVDRYDFRVRAVRAQEGGVKLARKIPVRCVGASARDQPHVLQT